MAPKAMLAQLFPRLSVAPFRAEGCVRGRELLYEIKLRGYPGSFSHRPRLLATWRPPNDAKVVTLPPVPEPTTAPLTTTIATVPCAVDPAIRVDDLANRRRFAMHQAAWVC